MSLVTRVNIADNPIGPNVAATTNLSTLRVSIAVMTGFVRATITDASVIDQGQRVFLQHAAPPLFLPALPGLRYTVTADGRSDVTTNLLKIVFNFIDSGGTTLQTPAGPNTAVGPTSGGFTAIGSVSAVSPAATAFIRPLVVIPTTGARSVGQIFDVRQIKVEAESSGAYFDGDSTATGVVYAWDGTAELSSSTERDALRRVVNQGSLTQSAVRAATI